tara:strand:- start:622 stop:951 length:330 start_codon:yes stop_codon:yes gene_type:complete
MPNPYAPSASTTKSEKQRPVRRFVVAAITTAAVSLLVSAPGIMLLNQDYWQLVPTNTYMTSFEFNGTSIANDSLIAYSMWSAIFALGMSATFTASAFRNDRKNVGVARR